MSDEKNNKFSLINLPDSADNAVKNLTNEPTKAIGQTLSDIWFLALGGISHAAEKKRMRYALDLESYKKELEAAVAEIPASKRIEPDIRVTAQALENSKYCVESKNLRAMFVKLISGAMNQTVAPYIHPSFPEILKQMGQIDAKILQELYNYGDQPIVDYILRVKSSSHAYSYMLENVYIPLTFTYPLQKIPSAISSLVRFGLIENASDLCPLTGSVYDKFRSTTYFNGITELGKNMSPARVADITKRVIRLSPLGRDFCHVCL